MNKFMTASAAAIAAFAVGSAAHADGYVDAGYTSINPSSGSNLDGLGFGGAAGVQLSTNWTAQFDAHWNRYSAGGSDVTFSSGAAHATYRAPDWSAGGYVSAGDVLGSGIYGIGAEGKYYIDRISLGGRIGYDTIDNSGIDAWDGDISGKYFFTDNLSAAAHYTRISITSSSGADVNVYGLGGEWKASSSPFGVFASYDRLDFSGSSGTADIWQIGARWSFGGDTLLKREHSGAGMSTGSGLATIGFLF
jgi:hypothetical protein